MKYTKALPAKHYGRIFYNLETSDPAGSGYMHASFVTADTAQQVRVVDTVRCSTGGCSGKQQFLYNWADDQGGKSSPYDYTPNVGVWSCAEWHVDSTTQTYEFWIDGSPVSSISGKVQRTIPAQYPDLSFGGQVYQSNAVVSGWIDDIAVSSSGRIGCDGPAPGPGPKPHGRSRSETFAS